LMNTTDPPEFNAQFYDICGEAVAELAPLLWFDRDRDGKRSLTKVYNPLIASLLTQSNLKSVLLKRMSKFVPKLLIGLATALPHINSDMILLKAFQDLVKNSVGKMSHIDLEPTLKMVFGDNKVKFIHIQSTLQKLFLNELSLYDKIHLNVLNKCLDLSQTYGTTEVIVRKHFGKLLDIQIRSISKDNILVKLMITNSIQYCHKSHKIQDFSAILINDLSLALDRYFIAKYQQVKEILLVVKQSCPEIYRALTYKIQSSICQLKGQNHILAKRAENELGVRIA